MASALSCFAERCRFGPRRRLGWPLPQRVRKLRKAKGEGFLGLFFAWFVFQLDKLRAFHIAYGFRFSGAEEKFELSWNHFRCLGFSSIVGSGYQP